jgi:hypothetical protein
MNLELYSVTIEYRDALAQKEYEGGLKDSLKYTPVPSPPPKRTTCQVAVYPGFGEDPVAKASAIAVRGVIGPPDCWQEFMPVIMEVKDVGSVFVEETK